MHIINSTSPNFGAVLLHCRQTARHIIIFEMYNVHTQNLLCLSVKGELRGGEGGLFF